MVEPNGSIRSVKYSAGPETGFQATVNNDGEAAHKTGRSMFEEKSHRDYEKYDYPEDNEEEDSYLPTGRKKSKHPFDSLFKDYSLMKRPKHPMDLEPSDFTHSITIKHPFDEIGNEPHSHQGINYDPSCKTKHNKETNNFYSNLVELNLKNKYNDNKHYPSTAYGLDINNSPSNFEPEKLSPYSYGSVSSKFPDYTESEIRQLANKYKNRPSFELDNNPYVPDIPSADKYYPDHIPTRPKKKNRPIKTPDYTYPSDNLDDYILVPKKKLRKPPRITDDYRQEEEDYGRPHYTDEEEDDDQYHVPKKGEKKVIRKIIKKRRPPVINLLDILDI